MSEEPTVQEPIYRKVQQENSDLFMIECNEGWRSSIVCTDMYEWSADWLISVLGRQPFAHGGRP